MLVGRDRELALVLAEFAQAASGEFRSVVLLGDPGIGKTRFAQEIAARPGVAALSARGHPLGATTAFGLWAEALEGHLRGLHPDEVAALCGGFLDDLAALLRSAAAARRASPPGEQPRARLLEGLAVLVTNLSAEGPLLIFLDDMHLADASSWDALHYLARNLRLSPVLVLAAARPAELAAQEGPTAILLGLEQDWLARRLHLTPLPTRAVGDLAGAVLGQAPPPTLVAWLDERSRGNPLFALGLLQALQDEGADLAAPRLDRLPEALGERVTVQLNTLDIPARSTLELLAVVGHRVELGSVVALTGRPLDRVGPILDGLVRARLVTVEERAQEVTYELAHPLVAEAIYSSLGAARRRALHRLVARVLLGAGRLGEAAPHFARSAQRGDTEAVSALCEATRQAEERGLYREGLSILGSLVDLLPPGDDRWLEVLDALTLEAEWVVDHRADTHAALAVPALRAIDSVLERVGDPRRRAAVQFRLTSFLAWGTGELTAAERAGVAARDLFEEVGDHRGMLLADLELAFVARFRGDLEAWMAGVTEVEALARASGDRLVGLHALGRGVAVAHYFAGRFAEAERACRQAIAMAREDGKAYFEGLGLTLLACSLAFEGRIGEAAPILAEVKVADAAWRDGLLGEYEIMVDWLAGDFGAALQRARDSLAWNTAGMSRRRALGIVFAALAAVETGDLRAARRYLGVARDAFGDGRWSPWSDCRGYAEAVLAGQDGDAVVALDGLRRTGERMLAMGCRPWAAFALVDLADMAAEAEGGHPDVAARAAADLDEIAAQLDRDLYRALASLGRASAHLASEAHAAAAAAAEEAVRLLSSMGYAGMLGRAFDLVGRSLAPDDRGRARMALERAVATFDACGATVRRNRALRAMRGLGAAGKQAAAALGSPALSPREREVATLAARGATAGEIARALFIGERTVESHLARIYAKLGVASKRDLLRRRAELGLEPS